MRASGSRNLPFWMAGIVVAAVLVAGVAWFAGRAFIAQDDLAGPAPDSDRTRADIDAAEASGEVSATVKPPAGPDEATATEPGSAAETGQADRRDSASTGPDGSAEDAPPGESTATADPPRLNELRLESDGLAVIAGQVSPFADVILRLDGAEIARASADGSGAFATVTTLAPSDAARVLTLAQIDDAGGEITSPDELILAPTRAPEPEDTVAADTGAVDETEDRDDAGPSPGGGAAGAASEPDADGADDPEIAAATTEVTPTDPADMAPRDTGDVAEPEVAAAMTEEVPSEPAGAAPDGAETDDDADDPPLADATDRHRRDEVARAEEAAATTVPAAPADLQDAQATAQPTRPETPAPSANLTAADAAPPDTGPEIAADPAADTTPDAAPDAATAPEVAAAAPEMLRPADAGDAGSPAAPKQSGATGTRAADLQAAPSRPESPQPGTAGQVAILRSNEAGVRVLRPADPSPQVMSQVALDSISYSARGDVELQGRAQEAARQVRVYLDNRPVASLDVDASGSWRGPLPQVDTGVYTLRIDELDATGQVTSRVETPFKREAPEVLAAATNGTKTRVAAVTVQKGDTLWAISRERYGEGILYVRVFEANRDSIRDPDLIYPGQIFTLPSE